MNQNITKWEPSGLLNGLELVKKMVLSDGLEDITIMFDGHMRGMVMLLPILRILSDRMSLDDFQRLDIKRLYHMYFGLKETALRNSMIGESQDNDIDTQEAYAESFIEKVLKIKDNV